MADKDHKVIKNIRDFPSISAILEDESLKPVIADWSFTFVAAETKRIAADMKKAAKANGNIPSKITIIDVIVRQFQEYKRELIQPVINGTGVILHTNLGRAPILTDAYQRLTAVVSGYSNLEFDLQTGRRSNRSRMPGRLLSALTGAESGMAVNNNAAAVYLIVAAMCQDRTEVVISRGQLIQIGGGFRIPEIIERSGAKLREVGTTNKTSLQDYQRAINKNTGLILIVHKSNFIQKGFTEEPDPARIVEIGGKKKVPVCFDLGSGYPNLMSTSRIPVEPSIQDAVRTGADLVCFSGDKLLGGPQAGLVAGKRKLITQLLKDPLYRTFRLDKITLGLLEYTLLSHLSGRLLPAWMMAEITVDELTVRAGRIVSQIGNARVRAVKLKSSFGGGSLPGYEFDSYGLIIDGDSIELGRILLSNTIPVIGRNTPGGIMIDLRTVLPEQEQKLVDAINACL